MLVASVLTDAGAVAADGFGGSKEKKEEEEVVVAVGRMDSRRLRCCRRARRFCSGFPNSEAEGVFSLPRILRRRGVRSHLSSNVRSYLAFVAPSLYTQLPYGPVFLSALQRSDGII